MGNPTYKKVQYTNDNGAWTVIRVIEEPVAMTYSQGDADALISKLESADEFERTKTG